MLPGNTSGLAGDVPVSRQATRRETRAAAPINQKAPLGAAMSPCAMCGRIGASVGLFSGNFEPVSIYIDPHRSCILMVINLFRSFIHRFQRGALTTCFSSAGAETGAGISCTTPLRPRISFASWM